MERKFVAKMFGSRLSTEDEGIPAQWFYTDDETDAIRQALSIPPGLTADEAEVVAIERRLEEALMAGTLRTWSWTRHSNEHPGYYGIQWGDPRGCKHYDGSTRLTAAKLALAHVETLEAEAAAKKRPEVEAMATGDVRDELRGRGWRFGFNEDHWFWQNASGFCVYMQDEETRCSFERRALRRARELADGA